MPVSSLKQVLTGTFVSSIGKVGQSSSKSANPLAASKDTQAIDITLKTGARNFAAGYQALNVAITYVNLSENTNKNLLSIVERLEVIVGKAGKGELTSSKSEDLAGEFKSLAKKFDEIIKGAVIKGENVLNVDDLSAALTRGGIDPKNVEEIGGALKSVSSLGETTSTAGGEVTKPEAALPITEFTGALRQALSDFQNAAEGETPDVAAAFATAKKALGKVHKDLTRNVKALGEVREVVAKNMNLARATGLAMLELSSSVAPSENPDDVAAKVRAQVMRSAGRDISQAHNLQSIMVTGLTAATKGKS